MRVYRHGLRERNLVLHIQPGQEFPLVPHWRDAQNNPVLMTLQFKNWALDTDENIGKYLIDKGLAFKSKIVIPTREEDVDA